MAFQRERKPIQGWQFVKRVLHGANVWRLKEVPYDDEPVIKVASPPVGPLSQPGLPDTFDLAQDLAQQFRSNTAAAQAFRAWLLAQPRDPENTRMLRLMSEQAGAQVRDAAP